MNNFCVEKFSKKIILTKLCYQNLFYYKASLSLLHSYHQFQNVSIFPIILVQLRTFVGFQFQKVVRYQKEVY